MRYYLFLTAILFIFSACSSTANTNAVNPAAANTNPANADAATNSNPSGAQPYNGNLNPGAFNATNDNLRVIPVERKKDELPYGSRYAPDDSVISSSSRGKEFLETRTFKSDAAIEKVEKIMDGSTTKYKVYLKNGKVLDAPAEKMTNFATMAPANILIAVGMETKKPANQQEIPAGKKEQNQ